MIVLVIDISVRMSSEIAFVRVRDVHAPAMACPVLPSLKPPRSAVLIGTGLPADGHPL